MEPPHAFHDNHSIITMNEPVVVTGAVVGGGGGGGGGGAVRAPGARHRYDFWNRPIPKLRTIKSLATVNLFVLAVRLVQLFFAGVILGIMAYFINLENQAKSRVTRSFIFSLVTPIFSIITQFNYLIDYDYFLFFVWDFAICLGYLISFFWLYDTVQDYLTCKWGSFNPFGNDRCAQVRSVMVMQIIESVLWLTTSVIAGYDVWRAKRLIKKKFGLEI